MNHTAYGLIQVAVIAGITILLRFLPFLVFRNGAPKLVLYLGKVLPYAIIGMLVVYCLRNVSFTGGSYGICEVLSVGLVVVLHKYIAFCRCMNNLLYGVGTGSILRKINI